MIRLRSLALTDEPYTFWEKRFDDIDTACEEFARCAEQAEQHGGRYVLTRDGELVAAVERWCASD